VDNTAVFAYAARMSKDFAGPGTGTGPADPMIAAGPDHVITVINTQIDFFTKEGVNDYTASHSAFFGLPSNSFVFDMKIRYDEGSDRFFMMMLEVDNTNYKSYFHLAVSTSSDPFDGWWIYPPLENDRDNNWVDYPGLGVSNRAVYFTGNYVNLFWPFPRVHTNVLWIIDKNALVNGQSATIWPFVDLQGIGGSPGTLMPAITAGLPAGAESFVCALQAATVPDPIKGIVWGVTLPANFPSGSPSLTQRSVDLFNPGIMVNAPQQGGPALIKADNLGSAAFDVCYRNGRLWTVSAYQGGGGSYLRYYEYNVSSWPTLSVANTGGFSASGRSYYWPAVTLNAPGDALIGFSSSGTTQYASARWTLRFSEDGSFGSSSDLFAGQDYYGSSTDTGNTTYRWGDYSGAAVDPTEQGIWIFHMYARTRTGDSGLWDTRVGYIPHAVFVDRAYAGVERGTRTRPYNTVGEGQSASYQGNDLVVRTGSYPGAVTLTKRGRIIPDGGSVIIGQ
jgi:hypothetical protein